MRPLTASQAFAIAAQWGSYVTPGDPGACFYSFFHGDARPTSEEHRKRCLAYLDTSLVPLLQHAIKTKIERKWHRAATYDMADLKQLKRLREWFETAPLYGAEKQIERCSR